MNPRPLSDPNPTPISSPPANPAPATSTAFHLPARLGAKSDPALIGGDDEHFAAISDTLERSIAGLKTSA